MAFEHKVFICSPFAPVSEKEEDRKEELRWNIKTAHRACLYALAKGFMPVAPHLYFTQFLNDRDPKFRNIGMNLGLKSLKECKELWVIDHIFTEGMEREIAEAKKLGIPIKYYVPQRSPEERLLDEIFFPHIKFIEMV